jgi:hypothetical protein
MVARSAAKLAARQLAIVEQEIAERGLRPESARALWHWRRVVAGQTKSPGERGS